MARTYTRKTAAALKAGASKRAPAKPNKFFPREVTPEYKAWAREDAIDHCVRLGMHPSWFFPEDDDKAEEYVVNRITPAKGRLQIDCIEVEEARRRVRDLKALLELAGIKEEK